LNFNYLYYKNVIINENEAFIYFTCTNICLTKIGFETPIC